MYYYHWDTDHQLIDKCHGWCYSIERQSLLRVFILYSTVLQQVLKIKIKQIHILPLCVDLYTYCSAFLSLCSLDTCETQISPLYQVQPVFPSCCWNQHLGTLCVGLIRSFMLWLKQMIRDRADGASKRSLHPQERRIKHIHDSVMADRMATEYRPSAALRSYWCRHRHKDLTHFNKLEVSANIPGTIFQTILYLLYRWCICHKNFNIHIQYSCLFTASLLLANLFIWIHGSNIRRVSWDP